MSLFNKPIRALDRLPSRFRPAKAKAAAAAEPAPVRPEQMRPDAFNRAPEPMWSGSGFRGPGNAVTLLIFMLSAALLTAIIILWRGGAAGPQAANGATPAESAKAPSAESVATLLGAAKSFIDQQDFPKAEAILRAAVREHGEDQELRIAFGETLMRQKKKGEAYQQYAKALEIGPRDPKIDFVAGTLASETGRPEKAIEHYQAAQSADPGNAQYPLYLAQVQVKQEAFEAAKVNLVLSAKLDGQNAVAWGTLAEIFLRDNKLDLAIQNITKARTLQPELARWKVVEARARSRKGDAEKALILLTTLDRSQQRDPNTMSLMAQCYGLLKRPADAVRLYGDASDAAPTDSDLAFEAANWAVRAGDEQTARKYATRAAKLGHKGAKALLNKLNT